VKQRVALIAVVVLGFFLTPWLAFAASAVIGVLFVLAIAVHGRERTPRTGLFVRVASVLIVVGVGYSMYVVTYAVWLPHEAVVYQPVKVAKPSKALVVGYVLDSSDGWMSILRSGSRDVVRLPTDSIVSRTICQNGTTLPFNAPSVWGLLGQKSPFFRSLQSANTPQCPPNT
jgi:hypothetical protein